MERIPGHVVKDDTVIAVGKERCQKKSSIPILLNIFNLPSIWRDHDRVGKMVGRKIYGLNISRYYLLYLYVSQSCQGKKKY